MNQADTLRGIVAKLGGIDAAAIGADFSLEIPALKGSLKRAALTAAIRRDLGINCRTAHLARSFGELEAAVFGDASSVVNAPTAATPPPASPAVPVAAAAALAATLPAGSPLATPLRCGVDLEVVAALPEAADYREHEFYRSHFSPGETAYCILQQNPRMHFAARWCAKEALYKAEPALRATPLSSLEVVRAADGAVSFRRLGAGDATPLPHALSLSHTESHAIALVVAPAAVAPVPAGPGDERAPASGSILPFISAVAWLIAVGLSVLALVRSVR
jgi:phosphopantetheine--protein transferase-like protein